MLIGQKKIKLILMGLRDQFSFIFTDALNLLAIPFT